VKAQSNHRRWRPRADRTAGAGAS